MSSAASDPSGLLEVGYIGKAHGLGGDVLVVLTSDLTEERTRSGARLWGEDRWLEVRTARPHKDRWVIRFDAATSRETAESLQGKCLKAEPIEDNDALFVHKLIGLSVVDTDGRPHGSVLSVLSNPASDLLELEGGQLVPLAFYVSHDSERITVDVPPGLLDSEEVGLSNGQGT